MTIASVRNVVKRLRIFASAKESTSIIRVDAPRQRSKPTTRKSGPLPRRVRRQILSLVLRELDRAALSHPNSAVFAATTVGCGRPAGLPADFVGVQRTQQPARRDPSTVSTVSLGDVADIEISG